MHVHLGLALLLVGASGCRRAQSVPSSERAGSSDAPQATVLPVDHVILAIDSLERGIELLREATGITAAPGGVHPGRGTRNALIGLGAGRYLELLAPNLSDTSATARASAPERGDYFGRLRVLTPVGWAVGARNAAMERARLARQGFPVGALHTGSRTRPDGRRLAWTTFDPWGVEREILPFVIAWDAGSLHPATDAPSGCALVSLAIQAPASTADSLRASFARAGWPVEIRRDTSERLSLDLACKRGRVHFPSK